MSEDICTCEHHNHKHCIDIEKNASKTLLVIIITLITMFVEILFGYITNSMALLSDGWHMGTHAFALAISYAVYLIIKKFNGAEWLSHGTDKITSLAGFVSSIFLGITGILVIFESVLKFFNPVLIIFDTAIIVAVLGLIVNGVSLLVMECKSDEKDYNFKAAYLHILADALTSLLAIFALLCGKFFGLQFLDPVMGIVGGVLILKWAIALIKDTTLVLLDIHR